MDVNGTRFHLLQGKTDWERCREAGTRPPSEWKEVAWNDRREALTLKPALSLFRHKKADTPVSLDLRRGAARDAYGNQFWIAENRQDILWIPAADARPTLFWTQVTAPVPVSEDEFTYCAEPPSEPFTLSGMAVTTHHYLVVGYFRANPADEKGVFLFDLRAGGPPTRLIFPDTAPFVPFDMTADAKSNVWILDRQNRAYWGLDREFRLIGFEPPAVSPSEPPAFAPTSGSDDTNRFTPRPMPVKGFPLEALKPVSIEALPDGTLLILDRSSEDAPSRLFRYALADRIGAPLDLVAQVAVVEEGTGNRATRFDVRGYDLAYLPDTLEAGTLYVVEEDGNQVIAFRATFVTQKNPAAFSVLTVQAEETYLPLHHFGGRAILAQGSEVYYDVTNGTDRDKATLWTTLQEIEQPRYVLQATLDTPVLDGKTQDCVWHRLFLDACLPTEAEVRIETRAANSQEILEVMPFTPEPRPYRRGAGTEIPWYDPFPGSTDADIGTYETLFQRAQGQYLQIRLTLTGSGRVTPFLYRLRAYYPRFSYPRNYLPTVYLEDTESLSFLERMLANTEGFYSEIEGKIENVSALFDPRSAPPETLDWLAGWMGLLLDPLWESIQQKRGEASARLFMGFSQSGSASCPRADRRRLLIRFARHLYERRGTLEGLQFALHLLLDPTLEAMLERLKEISVLPDAVRKNRSVVESQPGGVGMLARDLNRLGLPLPAPTTPEADLEDLLYALVIRPERPSPIRLIERFRTRFGRAAVEGDTPVEENAAQTESAAEVAHRFSVLIPQGLLPEEEAMVRRIMLLEKPAHTQFDVRYYWEGFRVGAARVGLDTLLGETPRYLPILLGRTALADGYLESRPPMDAADRVIADRDRVGDMPPL